MAPITRGLLFVGFAACGGVAIVDIDAALDASSDGGSTDSAAADDAGFPHCKTTDDCFMAQSCQAGLCCAGVVTNGQCSCGASAGCDIRSVCCWITSVDAGVLYDGGQQCVALDQCPTPVAPPPSGP